MYLAINNFGGGGAARVTRHAKSCLVVAFCTLEWNPTSEFLCFWDTVWNRFQYQGRASQRKGCSENVSSIRKIGETEEASTFFFLFNIICSRHPGNYIIAVNRIQVFLGVRAKGANWAFDSLPALQKKKPLLHRKSYFSSCTNLLLPFSLPKTYCLLYEGYCLTWKKAESARESLS